VTEVAAGRERELTLTPEQFGMARSSLDGIRVAGPAESAAVIQRVLSGEPGPARDIVVLNAAVGLIAVDAAIQPKHAADKAAAAIDSGAARELLKQLAELSHAKNE
jgi:anthranilate phosphoribosyltransferase